MATRGGGIRIDPSHSYIWQALSTIQIHILSDHDGSGDAFFLHVPYYDACLAMHSLHVRNRGDFRHASHARDLRLCPRVQDAS